MLRIRLSRRGAKKDPHYRVVVSDQKIKRDGRFVEILGYYNPALKPVRLNLDLERVRHWVDRGARPTPTVRTLIRRVEEAAPGIVEAKPDPSSTTDEAAQERSVSTTTEEGAESKEGEVEASTEKI